MDRKYNQDNAFEQFLREELKDHRMYPADSVWKKIRTQIHGNPTWPALTVISLLIIVGLTVSTLLIAPSAHQFNFDTSNIQKAEKSMVEQRMHAPSPREAYYHAIEPQHLTQRAIKQPMVAETELTVANTTIPTVETAIGNDWQMAKVNIRNIVPAQPLTPAVKEETETVAVTEKSEPESVTEKAWSANITRIALASVPEKKAVNINLSDEKLTPAVNHSLQLPIANRRIGFQFYATPSTSYRSLSDAEVKEIVQPNNNSIAPAQNVPLALSYTAGVNEVVRHRPAMGLEVGLAALYNINSRLKFKAGLQLNIRQYHIETFRSANGIATVSLLNNGSIENLNLFSSYNNTAGYKQEQLNNKSYQVAVPLGVQWDIIKGKQFGISAEATVQPTYSFNSSVFLLSTDYKNYTDGNGFVRRWNVNTSAGIHINFKSGSNQWQLGPQIRYQHLPTYTNRYPIKEYLMDYGIRLAYTKQR
ncbi:outer membrane beta-barrel protein [Sediminibacterium salmoneum]|uniref:outer membrane beta-barrel protein n=1 Tax=Sediminibacterium salmoneum TaxID=426421 RepID=UPI000478E81F|nr:outer membrane beta-barrel protein [Sediminibacterium salmoneum]